MAGLRGLEGLPELRRALRLFVDHASERPDVSVFLQGSLARGEGDRFSDIDLILVYEDQAEFERERAWVREVVSSAGRVVAAFAATHLGFPNLLIFFLDVAGTVVKIDVKLVPLEAFTWPAEAVPLLVSARARDLAGATSEGPPGEPDFADIQQKFCGWIWYTFTKIARGELLEAADSLDIMRQQGLLPYLHFVTGLPREGYRRLEQRLPGQLLQALIRTYPARLEPRELTRALLEMSDIFRRLAREVAQRLGHEPGAADLNWMIEALEKGQSVL